MGRKIIGSRACWRRNHHAIADQFFEPRFAVHIDAQLGCLMGLAKKADFVHGKGSKFLAIGIYGGHSKRMKLVSGGLGYTLRQIIDTIIIHEKADRATIHAIDAFAGIHRFVQHLQHKSVTTQNDDHVSLFEGGIAILLDESVSRILRFIGGRGYET